MERLEKLCRAHTDLSEQGIARLLEVEKQLPLIAEVTNADVFLDCLTAPESALVVAQARPTQSSGVYAGSVVGETASPEKEPAVFHAFRVGTAVCDLKAITQEGRSVRQNVAPVRDDQNRVIAVLIREKDVSEDMQQEKKLEELTRGYETEMPSLRAIDFERMQHEAAIREVHHRVKNNLQLVASILNLQARRSEDPNVQMILKENVSRVLSIAAIHDILTHVSGDHIRVIRSDALFQQLCRGLQALIPLNQHISLIPAGDVIEMKPDAATSVSLVVTELVTNAIQHAFPGRESGEIVISVYAGNLFHTVTVADNGVGFLPEEKKNDSLGLDIVRTTVRDKLKGKLHIVSDEGGTKASFDFKKE